jgi:DNA sulfur modification protein DndB
MTNYKFEYLKARQFNREFILTTLPARLVAGVTYASVRGKDKEEGAIQRVLNTSRISGIKDFTLAGGDFPNAFVLNWVSQENLLIKAGGTISFNDVARSAQIIDGQHRIAGIRAAIAEKSQIGDMDLPVVIYEDLTSRECADIFLSINTEQKPVARSLVFDLFGIASEDIVDPAALRARDIALTLHQTENSPYYELLKMPGAPIRKGGIALSTAVSAIKPLVQEKGVLEQIGVSELEIQRQIILNLFKSISNKYASKWNDKENVFLYAAGFMAAMQFFQLKLVPYCGGKESFSITTLDKAINMPVDSLIWQSETKGLGGSAATSLVFDRLLAAFEPDVSKIKVFEI